MARHESMLFIVRNAGAILGKFPNSPNAHRVAQMWSERFNVGTEVFDIRKEEGGIVGQYEGGMPTPEFRGRGDEAYPGSNVIGQPAREAS